MRGFSRSIWIGFEGAGGWKLMPCMLRMQMLARHPVGLRGNAPLRRSCGSGGIESASSPRPPLKAACMAAFQRK